MHLENKEGRNSKKIVNDIQQRHKLEKFMKEKVVETTDFGAFVNFMGSKDGLVHISQLKEEELKKLLMWLTKEIK